METPLAHLPPMYFIDLVVERNVRPERPKEDGVKCQGFSDGLWSIAECCWVKEPNRRPNANNLCDNMERCLAAHRESKVTSSPLPLLSGLPPGSSTWGAQVNSSPQPILQSGDHPTQKAPERLSRSSSQRSQQGSSPTSDPPFRHADANRILLNSSAGSTKQSPPPAITQQRSLWGNPSKRPLTIEQLKARAEDQLWGEKEDVGHSLKSVTRFHTDGKLFQEQGDIESAYVQFAKAETLALEKIPRDKTYLAPEGQRRVLDKVWTLHYLSRAYLINNLWYRTGNCVGRNVKSWRKPNLIGSANGRSLRSIYKSEERGIVLCNAPFFVLFEEVSIN